jgi:glycosyltransferase involved in cell wall biosynthesis
VKDFVTNAKLLADIGKDDVLFLHRTVHQLDFMLLVFIRKFIFGRGYAFDFDDAIFLEKGHADAKTKLIIRHADVVFCGSRFLEEYAKRFNKNVHVITTVLDTNYVHIPYEGKRDLPETVIGWTGTPVHLDNMRLLVPALTKLAAEGYPIRVQLLGGGPKIAELFAAIPGLKLTAIPLLPSAGIWAEPREVVRYLQNFDIGVMPLEKTEWNKGKDAYKAKEYMACGVATVVSPWGENPYIVHDGENGLLADDDEWYEKFKKLIDDKTYRAELAARGRKYTEEECSFAVFVPKILEILTAARHA